MPTPLKKTAVSTFTNREFRDRIQHEFIQGSAIAPALFEAATTVVSDTEAGLGGEVRYPIHEALNWRLVRFGHAARETLHAILLINEDDSPWQLKLSQPLFDSEKGKFRRYETPIGNGARAFLPAIDVLTWQKIALNHNLEGFLPTWIKNASAIGQKGLVSHGSGRLTDDEFESYVNKLKPIFATHLGKATSRTKGFSSHTEKNTSLNFQRPLTSTAKKSLKTSSNISDLILKTESTRCKSFLTADGSGKSSHSFSIETTSFWQWVELLPVPIVLTEGGKKALCLLSLGYVAIALYGVNGGYRSRDEWGNKIAPHLISDLARFAVENRSITLAFDQDAKPQTRGRVNATIARFGGVLAAAGCTPTIAQWSGLCGKGVDDLVVQSGDSAWETAYNEALPLEHWSLWQRLENRLTVKAAIRVKISDLSNVQIENLPERCIVAFASAKGTGKTKAIAPLLEDAEKALAAGHRIALMRNLSNRLGLSYRGDIDKVNGEIIDRSTGKPAFLLRQGFCVDSLLAIDPEKFRDCDLVLDEVVQVVRHILTSSTCAKDGKRPALLRRLKELIQVARRVIVADADLDNATLQYVKELRGDDTPIILIRNEYESIGYSARFLRTPDRSAIVAETIAAAKALESGKVLYVATDSLHNARAIAQLLAHECPQKRVLAINSKTSGGELEREFIQTPDAVLARREYDVILSTPSMATGVSIEVQGVIDRVYGIFTGGSSTDADMAQALSRVREPVERVVWCAVRGSNFCKVSRSSNALELKAHLRDRTSTTVCLIRSNLREDQVEEIEAYDWQSDPHLNLFCRIAAEQNRSMWQLRDALLVRLKFEGNVVIEEDRERSAAVKLLLKQSREDVKQIEAKTLIEARVLTYKEVGALENKEDLSLDDRRAIARYYLTDFYAINPHQLTVEDVINDRDGRRRGEILNLEAQVYPGIAPDRTAKMLEKQAIWNQGLCPWDISGAELRRRLRADIGLDDFLTGGLTWIKADLKPYADRIRGFAQAVKLLLNFTVKPEMSDVQLVHQLLSQLGLKIAFRWSRCVEGHEGEKIKVFQLDNEHWESLIEVLSRRQAKREASQAENGSPIETNHVSSTGDPSSRLNTALLIQMQKPEELTKITRLEARSLLEITSGSATLTTRDFSD